VAELFLVKDFDLLFVWKGRGFYFAPPFVGNCSAFVSLRCLFERAPASAAP
jgi:hypothetical protein